MLLNHLGITSEATRAAVFIKNISASKRIHRPTKSMSSIPMGIAGTIQSASINHNPDPRLDINPSTAASRKAPVKIKPGNSADTADLDEDEIPLSALEPVQRRQNLPPLPDLRFEQSYLRSIEKADTWAAVSWITFRDQFVLPLAQGTLWELGLTGWRFWIGASSGAGATSGSRIRHWLVSNGFLRR